MNAVDHDPVECGRTLGRLDGLTAGTVHGGLAAAADDRLLAHGTARLLILPPDARTGSTARPESASG